MVKRTSKTFGIPFAVLFCGVALSQQATNSTQAPPVTGLKMDQATLSVENLQAEAEWYERVLGFKVALELHDRPEISNLNMVIPGYRIDLIKYTGSKRPAPTDPVFLTQGWNQVIFSVDDIDKAAVELQALHAKADLSRDSKGKLYLIHLHDPEGNEVRLRPTRVLDAGGLPVPGPRADRQ